jgi:hypothetical protein
MDNTDVIWYNNISGFININNYYEIIPSSSMSLEAKINALVRLFIYIGVIIAFIRVDYTYLFIGIIAALVSIVLYTYEHKNKLNAEKFLNKQNIAIVDNKVCQISSIDNPFMNPSLIEYGRNSPKSDIGACDVTNLKVSQSIDDNFNAKIFRNVSDIYDRESSQREFYTVPVTTMPSDQKGFAEWLFKTPPTCKEGNGLECKLDMYRKIGV